MTLNILYTALPHTRDHSYPLHPDPSPPPQKDRDPAAAAALLSHSNPSGGQLVLGHASLLTAFVLTGDERYIVTADRDEHVRVSWYPEGYVVERFCLGHERFVSMTWINVFLGEC
jgi:tRNA (guanine-N(7)-)-methyltransferase subunit TRM82